MVIWITGLSGSGKTTIAKDIYTQLKEEYKNTVFLDGDIIREALNNSYGYSLSERLKGAKQVSGLCRMLDAEDLIVVCATMSLFHEIQELNRNKIKNYLEIYLNVDLEELIRRDSKDLYKKALNKEMDNVVGIDLDYESPIKPDIELDNNLSDNLESNIKEILDSVYLKLKG